MSQPSTMEAADRRFGWFMSAPGLALLLAVILFPVFWALFTSVHEFTLIAPNFDTFTGIENYAAALGDPAFRHSLGLTAFFVGAVVLIEFAINDADMLDGVALKRSAGNLRAIIVGLRESRPEALIVVASTNPVLGLRGIKRPFLADYYAAARSVAKENGAAFFDGTARWRAQAQPGDLGDGLHPANASAARIIVPALTTFLGAAYGKDC